MNHVKRRTFTRLSALLAVGALTITACGGSDDDTDGTDAAATTEAEAGSDTTEGEAMSDTTEGEATTDTTEGEAMSDTTEGEAMTDGTDGEAMADGEKIGVSLIVKTLSNNFFVSMSDSAQAEADSMNIDLTVAAGSSDEDSEAQIAAIEAAIAKGDKGILITPVNPNVEDAMKKARDAGLYVIVLDTPPEDPESADIVFATDNTKAGELDGQWAAASMGGEKAVIAMLDLTNEAVVSVDYSRDQGFLMGMGIIDAVDTSGNGNEPATGSYSGGEYEIVCHEETLGQVDLGKTAMEACLAQNSDINLVYTINEPAASGAAEALEAAGKTVGEDVTIVSVDGGCSPGIELVEEGKIGATAMQFPGKMATLGMEAIRKFADTGEEPQTTEGLDFFDTGVALVTDNPVDGVESIDVAAGKEQCWG